MSAAASEEITPARYQTFVDAFVASGPRFALVARKLGADPRLVRRLWERGIPGTPYGKPISAVYADRLRRLETARALTPRAVASGNGASDPPSQVGASGEKADPTDQIRNSAIAAVQNEADLLKAFRGNLIGAVNVSSALLRGFERLAEGVAESMILNANNVAGLTPRALLNPLEKFARITGLLAQSTRHVVEMQRLILGAPQSITEARGNGPAVMDPTERRERIARIFGQLQRSGLIEAETSPSSSYAGEETDTKAETIDSAEVKSG